MAVICSACGQSNDDDSDFCSSCGELLEWTGVRAEEEPPPEAPVAAAAPPPAPVADTPPPAPEAPAAAAPVVAAAAAAAAPPAPPKPSRFGRKAKPPVPPPPRPAAAPVPVPVPEPPAEEPEPPAAEEPAPAEPPVEEPPAAPPGPAPRPPEPRKPTVLPTAEEEEDEAARLAEEEEQRRREEQARKLVVPVPRAAEPAPVVAEPVYVAPPPEKLTWWQRFVRWFKRVILRQKPAAVAAVAVAAPVAAAAPEAAAAAPAAAPSVGARAPAAQKPGEEVQRRTPKAVQEEAPEIQPGDLICTQCGTGNNPNNKFCKRCGTSLAEAVVATKPSFIKRFFGKFSRKKRYAAGQRRKKQMQDGGQKKSVFWRLQGGGFKIVAVLMLGLACLGAFKAFGGTLIERGQRNFWDVKQLVLPTFKDVTAVSATASSHLDKKHSAGKAIDLTINTSWISKPSRKDGVNQTLTIHYQQPIRVGKIGLRNGIQDPKNPKAYATQARLETAVIFFYDKAGQQIPGKAKTCGFDDKPEFQTCDVDVRDVKAIKVRAKRVYRSQKGNSLAIAEIETKKRG